MLLLWFINCALVAIVVAMHYWVLFRLVKLMPVIHVKDNVKILVGVLGALIAHALEVWVFGFAYFLMNGKGEFGYLDGSFDGSLLDSVYFSFATFTTVGYGDVFPEGGLRFTAGIEALTGLVLITWTASFLFLEMQRHWKER